MLGRRAAARERDRRPGRDRDGQDAARPAVPPRGGAERRAGDPLHAGGDAGPASADRARPRLGPPPVRGAGPADAQLRSRPSSCRPTASSIGRGAQVEQLGARRAVLDSLTSMALGVPSERRFKELVYAIAKHFHVAGRHAQHEHGDRRPARLGAALGPRGLVRRRQRDPAQVRGDRGPPRARALGAQGARRAARHRRAPAQRRRGRDRGRIGVRGAARRAHGPARAVGRGGS